MAGVNGPISVSALIPCLNEENTIALCIDKAYRAFESMGVNGEVVVADNGSTDSSVDIAAQHGARVIHVTEKGYGAVLIGGIEACIGDTIVMGDADDSYDWSAIEGFVRAVDGGGELVMGNRFQGGIEAGAMPLLHQYLGNPVLSFIARVVFKAPIGDFHCGMRAFKKESILSLNLKSTGMEFATEMVANAFRMGLNIVEIPTKLYKDKRGRPPHLNSFRDGWRHLRFMLTYAPDHLFLLPGATLFLVGMLCLTALSFGPVHVLGVYFGIHYLALSCLMVIVGYSVLWMGLLAKTIVSTKFQVMETPLVVYFSTKFNLEVGLVIGAFMLVVGGSIDIYIFSHWLNDLTQSMDSTVHAAFSASTLIAIGFITMFNSFLLTLQKEFIQ